MIFKVSGSLTSATNYRYVCDVKNGAGTTTLARLKCDKLPTTNYGFFDVSRVVETLMAPTVPTLAQVGFADHAGFYSGYRLTFMEEYGNTPVVYTGTVTTVSGRVAFAGNLEQLELATWSGGLYFPSGAIVNETTRMLTTPTTRTVYADGYGWLSIGQFNYGVEKAYIQYWSATGATFARQFDVLASNVSGSNVIRFGVGPMNLKALTSGQCLDGNPGDYLFQGNPGDFYDVYFSRGGIHHDSSEVRHRAMPAVQTPSLSIFKTNTEALIPTPLRSRTARGPTSAGRRSATTRTFMRPLPSTKFGQGSLTTFTHSTRTG